MIRRYGVVVVTCMAFAFSAPASAQSISNFGGIFGGSTGGRNVADLTEDAAISIQEPGVTGGQESGSEGAPAPEGPPVVMVPMSIPDGPPREAARKRRSGKIVVTPIYISADEAQLAGTFFEYATEKYSFIFRGLNVNPDGADSFGKYYGAFKYKLSSEKHKLDYGFAVDYDDLGNLYDTIGFGGYIEKDLLELVDVPISVGGTLYWREQEFEPSLLEDVDDFGGSLNVSWTVMRGLVLLAEYQFEDDINTQDTLSANVLVPLILGGRPIVFSLGVDTEDTVVLATTFTF